MPSWRGRRGTLDDFNDRISCRPLTANTAIMIVAVIGGVMGTCALPDTAERKISAWMQDRIGPNRVGPGGLLQPIADGVQVLPQGRHHPVPRRQALLHPRPGHRRRHGAARPRRRAVRLDHVAAGPGASGRECRSRQRVAAANSNGARQEYRSDVHVRAAPRPGHRHPVTSSPSAAWRFTASSSAAGREQQVLACFGSLRSSPDHQLRDPAGHVGPRRRS